MQLAISIARALSLKSWACKPDCNNNRKLTTKTSADPLK